MKINWKYLVWASCSIIGFCAVAELHSGFFYGFLIGLYTYLVGLGARSIEVFDLVLEVKKSE